MRSLKINDMEYNKEHLLDVLRAIFKWKRPIIYVTLGAGIIAAIVSLVVTPKFEAKTTFYAASPTLQSPDAIFGQGNNQLFFYGSGDDIDRLIQLGYSSELLNYLTDEFDLYKHYDIDSTSAKGRNKLIEKLVKRYKITKNERDALDLTVEDRDKELSAKMANAARNKLNEIANGLIKSSQQEIITTFEKQIEIKSKERKIVSDSLSSIRKKYGIFDAGTTAKSLSGYSGIRSAIEVEKARLDASKRLSAPRDSIRNIGVRIATMEARLKAFDEGEGKMMAEGISQISALSEQEDALNRELGYDRSRYLKYKTAFEVPKQALFVQDVAEVPLVRSWPQRKMMVLGAMFIAFALSLLTVLIIEYNRDVNWKEIWNAK